MERKSERQENTYRCGQCKEEQYTAQPGEPPVPCPECGWSHRGEPKYDVPPMRFKL